MLHRTIYIYTCTVYMYTSYHIALIDNAHQTNNYLLTIVETVAFFEKKYRNFSAETFSAHSLSFSVRFPIGWTFHLRVQTTTSAPGIYCIWYIYIYIILQFVGFSSQWHPCIFKLTEGLLSEIDCEIQLTCPTEQLRGYTTRIDGTVFCTSEISIARTFTLS